MEISVPIDVKQFINQEISALTRRQIVPLIQQSYDLVDACLEDTSFLKWVLGKRHRGYLDNISAQFILYEAARNEKLRGVSAQIVWTNKGSHGYVELKTKNTVITINRASSKHSTARQAIYRSILQRDNQYYIKFDDMEIAEEPGYLELTHNRLNGKVDFVNLGIPDGKGKWFSCIDLTKELHLIGTQDDELNRNEVTKEQLVRFKNFAQEVREDGGKN